MNTFKNFMALSVGALLAACASNPPANNNDEVRARANAAYAEVPGDDPTIAPAQKPASESAAESPTIQLSNATFRSAPTVLVSPALSGKMVGSIDVIRQNPLAKTAMEVINAYLTGRGYTVVGLESQAQLDEVVQLQSDIAGNDDDLAYVAGLSVGADINITYAGSIQENDIVIDLNASEASTANLLASESVRMKNDPDESQRSLVQRAMQNAIVAHLTGEFTDDQAEEISNIVSLQLRKKFNKMQVISMSRNTYDLMIYADPDKYEDAQMVYGEFVESLSGLAKVRKQNITKKLIILEIK